MAGVSLHSYRRAIYVAAIAALGIACVSVDALAAGRGGAAGHRSGAAANRSGAVANRAGAVADRGGAVADRRGQIGEGYYRPGVGLAAGAVVGGAIAASQPWYGGYGYDTGYYGYNPDYSTGYYNPGYTAAPYTPAYPAASTTPAGSYAYGAYDNSAGNCTSSGSKIMCNNQCWLNTDGTNYRWADCPAHYLGK